MATSTRPSWGVQIFGGAQIFGDLERARTFQSAAEQIRGAIAAAGS
jgi:hypothetical protein